MSSSLGLGTTPNVACFIASSHSPHRSGSCSTQPWRADSRTPVCFFRLTARCKAFLHFDCYCLKRQFIFLALCRALQCCFNHSVIIYNTRLATDRRAPVLSAPHHIFDFNARTCCRRLSTVSSVVAVVQIIVALRFRSCRQPNAGQVAVTHLQSFLRIRARSHRQTGMPMDTKSNRRNLKGFNGTKIS